MAARKAELLRCVDEMLGNVLVKMDGHRVERERTDDQYQRLLEVFRGGGSSVTRSDGAVPTHPTKGKSKSKAAKKKRAKGGSRVGGRTGGSRIATSSSSAPTMDLLAGGEGDSGPPEWRVDLLRLKAQLVDNHITAEAIRFRLLTVKKVELQQQVPKAGFGWHRGSVTDVTPVTTADDVADEDDDDEGDEDGDGDLGEGERKERKVENGEGGGGAVVGAGEGECVDEKVEKKKKKKEKKRIKKERKKREKERKRELEERETVEGIMQEVDSDESVTRIEEENRDIEAKIFNLECIHLGRKKEEMKGKQVSQMEAVSAKLHAKFSPYSKVDKIIRDPKTKEAYNISMYINSCLEGQSEIPNPYDLIYALRDELLRTHEDLSQPQQIEASLEAYIFPQIYNKMMQNLDMGEEDKHIERQCKLFTATTQEQMRINPALIDDSLVPYYDAIAQLRTIYFAFSPTKKLYAIIEAVKAIYEVTGRLQPDLTVGGDDFIDIWVYVVLHAQIRNLASTIVYIQEYGNADIMDTELGYYFTSLELAYNFIKTLTPDKLKTNPHAAVTEKPFVVVERSRYEVFCSTDSHVDMLGVREELQGYRAWVVEAWLRQPGRFYCTYLQRTNDAADRVQVAVLKTNDSISPSQQTFLLETFFKDKPAEGLAAASCRLGAVLHSRHPPPAASAALIHSGDFDADVERIKATVNLRQLGKALDLDALPPYFDAEEEAELRTALALSPALPLGDAVLQMVKDVQVSLKHLAIFPWMCVVDGILSEITVRCIAAFQKRYNQANSVTYEGEQLNDANLLLGRKSNIERPQQLATDGQLTPATRACIRYRLQDFVDALEELGYGGVADPVAQQQEFSGLVRRFQVDQGDLDDGLLSAKTVNQIVKKLKALQRGSEPDLAVATE